MLLCQENCLMCMNDKCLQDVFLCVGCGLETDESDESTVNSLCWTCFDSMVLIKLEKLGYKNVKLKKVHPFKSPTLSVLDYIKNHNKKGESCKQ